MSKAGQEKLSPQSIALPIEWHYPETIQSRYATNMLVQAGEHEIVLSFFEAQLPLLVGQPEDNKAKLEQMGAIKAECVARIIIAPERLPSLITALQTSLDLYLGAK